MCAGCFALCCLPVFTCKVTKAVGACPCLPLLDCIGCVPPASLAMRASVRQRYGIQVERGQTKHQLVGESYQKYVLVCLPIYLRSFKPNQTSPRNTTQVEKWESAFICFSTCFNVKLDWPIYGFMVQRYLRILRLSLQPMLPSQYLHLLLDILVSASPK